MIFVYDVTNESTFECLENWLDALKNVNTQNKPPVLAIAGNKCDLEHQRAIKLERHQKFANEHHLSSFIVSARTGESVSIYLFEAFFSFNPVANLSIFFRLISCFKNCQLNI